MDFTWYLGEARHVGMALTNFSLQGSKQMILLLIKNNFLLLLFFLSQLSCPICLTLFGALVHVTLVFSVKIQSQKLLIHE